MSAEVADAWRGAVYVIPSGRSLYDVRFPGSVFDFRLANLLNVLVVVVVRSSMSLLVPALHPHLFWRKLASPFSLFSRKHARYSCTCAEGASPLALWSVPYSRTGNPGRFSGQDWIRSTHNMPTSLAPNWLVSAELLQTPSRWRPSPGHNMARPKCEIRIVGVRHHGSRNATGPARPSGCHFQRIQRHGAR